MTQKIISSKTTHDLWVEARQFEITLTRPTPDTLEVMVKRPVGQDAVDGAIILLSTSAIGVQNYPREGEAYPVTNPQSLLTPGDMIGDARVIASFHAITGTPFPDSPVVTPPPTTPPQYETFTVTVTDADPNTIYYASVHASSNVLQYYPLGVQSYPLETVGLGQRNSSSYTGNIPQYPMAPTNPAPGTVYHDTSLNIVQYFDAGSGSWIPTRTDAILSGPYNPGVRGQVYINSGNLKIFDGKMWVDANSANMLFRATVGETWRKMGSFQTTVKQPTTTNIGDVYYDFSLERIFYYNGSDWVVPTSKNALLDLGANQVEAFITPVTTEYEPLRNPYLGQLFYNLTTQSLNAYNGSTWEKVNTDQGGVPTTDKINIGTDGSYDERVDLIKILMGQLGWPQQCVELQEEQFNIAIDNALARYRQLSSGAYRRGFILYKLIPGQQRYYLNSATDKTDHIVDMHKIHRLGPMGVFGGGPNDVWAQAFAQQYYNLSAGGGDILSVHLVAAYGEELQKLFAGDLLFQWDEASRELFITRAVRYYETVVMEAMLERTEQELLRDRWCQQFLQNWALSELKMMLGLIRSKFTSGTPGPAGSISLNGELLISEARQDQTDLKEAMLNYEYGELIGVGNCSLLLG